MTGLHLTETANGVDVRPTGPGGRCIRTHGALADRLSSRTGDERHLLRPQYRRRGNTVNFVVARVGLHDQGFTGFQARRARHRWIANLMRSAVPTAVVLELADLESDNHTLTDLAAHMRSNCVAVDAVPPSFGGA